MNDQAIGIFDSGLGGISVWREMRLQLPNESMIYVADSGYCPYGSRPLQETRVLSERIVRFLLTHPCKLVVIACNTATAAAITSLRKQYQVPFVGMEPAVKAAVEATQSGVIGVLATRATLQSAAFQQMRERYAKQADILVQEGNGLVELVEHGNTHSPEAISLLTQYLPPMLEANADQIVLGCTHYPFLMEVMQPIIAGRAELINPAPAVGQEVSDLLQRKGLCASGEQHVPHYHFYTTGTIAPLQRMVRGQVPADVYDTCQFWRVELPVSVN